MSLQIDESLWNIAINTYYPRLVNLVYCLTRDRHTAEDIVQEAFAKAICSFHQLKDPDKFKPWITQIALNTAKTWMEKSNHITYLAEIETAATSFDLPLEAALHVEIKEVVLEAISQLSPQEQKVVVLRFYFDLMEKQIANILGIREGTVKSVLYRSKQKIGEKLSTWYGGERNDNGRR